MTGNVDGLSVGSVVKLRGVAVGKVTEIGFSWNMYEVIQPAVVVVRFKVKQHISPEMFRKDFDEALKTVVASGLRATVQGQGITGTSVIALQTLDPKQYPPLTFPWKPDYPYIPSAPSQFGQILASIDKTLQNLSQLDIQRVVHSLDKTLASAYKALDRNRRARRQGHLVGSGGRADRSDDRDPPGRGSHRRRADDAPEHEARGRRERTPNRLIDDLDARLAVLLDRLGGHRRALASTTRWPERARRPESLNEALDELKRYRPASCSAGRLAGAGPREGEEEVSMPVRVVIRKALALAAVCAAGCVSKAPLAVQSYTIDPPASSAAIDLPGAVVVSMSRVRVAPPYAGTSFAYRIGRASRRARSVRHVRRAAGLDADLGDPRISAKRGLHPRRRGAGRRIAGRRVDRGRRGRAHRGSRRGGRGEGGARAHLPRLYAGGGRGGSRKRCSARRTLARARWHSATRMRSLRPGIGSCPRSRTNSSRICGRCCRDAGAAPHPHNSPEHAAALRSGDMNAGAGAGAPPTPVIALRNALLGAVRRDERRRRGVRELSEQLVAFVDAPSAGERLDAWMAVVAWTRHGGLARSSDQPAEELVARRTQRLRFLLSVFESSPEAREAMLGGLVRMLGETEGAGVFGEAGLPTQRGFFSELGDRLMRRLLPVPRDGRDLARALGGLFPSDAEVERLRRLPPEIFHRVVTVVAPSERPRSGSRFAWRSPTVSGCWRRGPPRRVSSARSARVRRPPGLRHRRSTGWPARRTRSSTRGSPAGRPGPWRRNGAKLATECWGEVGTVRRRLKQEGVSIEIVFALDVIDRSLNRMEAMLEIIEAPPGERRSAAIQRFLARLAALHRKDQGILALAGANLQMLARRIVERSGRTGEHYIAADRKQYWHLWLAAAGGGALTVFTAAVKVKLVGKGLPPFPKGFSRGSTSP